MEGQSYSPSLTFRRFGPGRNSHCHSKTGISDISKHDEYATPKAKRPEQGKDETLDA